MTTLVEHYSPSDLALSALLRTQSTVESGAASLADSLRRRYAESRVVWFAIVIPIAIFLGLALIAYLTVQCWNRGYAGFSGLVNVHFTDWTHFNVSIRFACVR
ncbi:hypothetical protein acdb102_17090 [Acidothermaceae bacterium B102]|nr:hypothetical protein acdb102_17090 [Acidothermaceae bacterium B102]